ncbi:MAG: hypothetical protein MUC87_03200 [Bacteroidia bacterium]|jgi:hypothetical protein|nr:hypothetical protein [Bacteroidia bacterium]
MKKVLLLFWAAFIPYFIYGNPMKGKLPIRFEIGIIPVNVNSGYRQNLYNNPVEYFDAVYVKLHYNKFIIRASAAYTRSLWHYPFHDSEGIITRSGFYRIGAGIQKRLKVSDDYSRFFVFADMNYKQWAGTGFYTGNHVFNTTSIIMNRDSKGVEVLPGCGINFRLGNWAQLCVETGVNMLFVSNKYTYPFVDNLLFYRPCNHHQFAAGFFLRAGFALVRVRKAAGQAVGRDF